MKAVIARIKAARNDRGASRFSLSSDACTCRKVVACGPLKVRKRVPLLSPRFSYLYEH